MAVQSQLGDWRGREVRLQHMSEGWLLDTMVHSSDGETMIVRLTDAENIEVGQKLVCRVNSRTPMLFIGMVVGIEQGNVRTGVTSKGQVTEVELRLTGPIRMLR